eukprot:TRINITY_DN22365_c0_g1_i1.p1 TRINITY_DN22365_c0_g1~~TRINITY_DN22365_c0_g1_i1.p1  ORF type:complete len:398 (+),score=100.47 TRINITY_DN22365_c0_g1_i1:79-1272(+)
MASEEPSRRRTTLDGATRRCTLSDSTKANAQAVAERREKWPDRARPDPLTMISGSVYAGPGGGGTSLGGPRPASPLGRQSPVQMASQRRLSAASPKALGRLGAKPAANPVVSGTARGAPAPPAGRNTAGIAGVVESMFNDPAGTFADIEFRTSDGHVMKAHKCIVASQSPYLHRVFTAAPRTEVVDLEAMRLDVLMQVMRYLYRAEGWDLLQDPKSLIEVLAAADFLELPKFRKNFETVLAQGGVHFTPALACDMATQAHLTEEGFILPYCMQYMLSHGRNVLRCRDALQLPLPLARDLLMSNELSVGSELDVFEFARRYITAPQSPDRAHELLSAVRLTRLDPRSIENAVEPYGLYDAAQVSVAYKRIAMGDFEPKRVGSEWVPGAKWNLSTKATK